MSRHQRSLALPREKRGHTETLLMAINAAHEIFQARHNWLSPLTNDEERKQFIVRCGDWWNKTICPAMDAIGAVWNEQRQCFELPLKQPTNKERIT
jgi:hypothetical protein